MSWILIIVSVFSGLIENGLSNPALYDQRQTGDTNVRIDIKDATFILMEGGEMGDYDYSYDYSDLTVKPETTPTTPKPISMPPLPSSTTTSTSTTTETSTTINGPYVLEKENNTLTITPNKQGGNSSEPNKIQITQPQIPLNSQNYQIPVVVITETEKPASGKPPEKNYVSSSEIRKKNAGNVTSVRTEELPLRNCALGYFLDSKNRCKKIKRPAEQRKRPQLPFGLRFAQRPEAMNA